MYEVELLRGHRRVDRFGAPRLERQAADDFAPECLEAITGCRNPPGDLVHDRPVVTLQATTEQVDQELLGQRLRDVGAARMLSSP